MSRPAPPLSILYGINSIVYLVLFFMSRSEFLLRIVAFFVLPAYVISQILQYLYRQFTDKKSAGYNASSPLNNLFEFHLTDPSVFDGKSPRVYSGCANYPRLGSTDGRIFSMER